MFKSPRDARIAGCAVVLLAGGVVANVAYLQPGPRERRAPNIPVGLHVPHPGKQVIGEARRQPGPVTLSLASLLEGDAASTQPTAPASPPVKSDAASVLPGRMVGIAKSIDRLVVAQPDGTTQGKALDLVRQVQAGLAARGYAPGPVDGEAGLLTRAAILAFEQDQGLPATSEPSEALLQALRAPAAARRADPGATWQLPSRSAVVMVRSVQQHLVAAGFLAGPPTGHFDAATVAAIRAFEAANDLLPTGRISAPLMAKLQRAGAQRARVASGQ